MIDKLLKSKSMQNMMLSNFKKALKEEGIKSVVISLNDKDEAEAQYFKEEIKIVPLDQWKKIQEQLKSSL